jgi:hypothetical protein
MMGWIRKLFRQETAAEMRERINQSLAADRRKLFARMILKDE